MKKIGYPIRLVQMVSMEGWKIKIDATNKYLCNLANERQDFVK